MKVSHEGICVEFGIKNNTTLVFPLSNCPQLLTIFYDWPVKYYSVQLFLHSTRALFQMCFASMTYRWICILLDFEWKSTFMLYIFAIRITYEVHMYLYTITMLDLKECDSFGSGWLYSVSLMADMPVSELSIWPHCLHRWPNMLLLI